MNSHIEIEGKLIHFKNKDENLKYISQLINCLKNSHNALLETQSYSSQCTQLHLNILQQYLEKSQEQKIIQPKQFFFFCKSYQVLQNLSFTPTIKIIPNRQYLCLNSSVNIGQEGIEQRCLKQGEQYIGNGAKCRYYKPHYNLSKTNQSLVFNEIEDYKYLLKDNHICPFYYEKQTIQKNERKKNILVGTHADFFNLLLQDLKEKSIDLQDSLVFLDDITNIIPILENKLTPTIDLNSLKKMIQFILGLSDTKKPYHWEQKFEIVSNVQLQQIEIESNTEKIFTFTTKQIEIVNPIINFINRAKIHFGSDMYFKNNVDDKRQKSSYRVYQPQEAANFVNKLTESKSISSFEQYCSQEKIIFNVQDLRQSNELLKRKFQEGITESNYEDYIIDLLSYTKSDEITDHFNPIIQWANFLQTAFQINIENLKNNTENYSQNDESNFLLNIFQPNIEPKSLNGSFQENQVQDEKDYRLIVLRENSNTILKLNCTNPSSAIKLLQKKGMRNIIISSPILFPTKLFDAELGLQFQTKLSYSDLLDQEIVDNNRNFLQVKVGILQSGYDGSNFRFQNILSQKAKQNSIEQQLNPLIDIQFDGLIQSLGKTLQNLLCVKQHAFLVLFSSKSIMNHCHQHWVKNNIITNMDKQRSFNWVDSSSSQVIYESLKLFINRTQNYTSDHMQIPSLYMRMTPQFLQLFDDALIMTERKKKSYQFLFQQKLPITCIFIGVPWANSSLYDEGVNQSFMSNIQFELKLKWLKQNQSRYDQKQFSIVNAIKTLSYLLFLLNRLHQTTLVLCDEQFSWKQIWKQKDLQKLTLNLWPNIQVLIDQLNQVQLIYLLKSKQKKETKPLEKRNIEEDKHFLQQIQQIPQATNPISSGRKRKLMLNRVCLGSILKPPSEQIQKETNEIDKQLMGDLFLNNPTGKKSTIRINERTQETLKKQQQISPSPDKDNQCIICWGNTKLEDLWKSRYCQHAACWECWQKWLENKLECPMCRSRVRAKFLEKITTPQNNPDQIY